MKRVEYVNPHTFVVRTLQPTTQLIYIFLFSFFEKSSLKVPLIMKHYTIDPKITKYNNVYLFFYNLQVGVHITLK